MRELLNNIIESVKDAHTLFVDTGKIPEDIFKRFVRGDPTRKGKYVEWICKQYTIDPSRPEHLLDVVRMFDRLVQRKKIKKTDIYKYNLESLEQAIEGAKGVRTKGEIRTEIKADVEKVFENEDWLVISPKTYEAACFYGKGTKWCITGRIKEYWSDYTMRGVKFYFVMDKKDKDKKYAVAVYLSGEMEVYDEVDKIVPNERFKKIFKIEERVWESTIDESKGLISLLKVYKAHERKIPPEQSDVIEALWMMKEYYEDYINWWKRYRKQYGTGYTWDEPPTLKADYGKRFFEIELALKSKDINQQIITLDNAVNQWHADFPVIHHLAMGAKDDKLEEIVDEIETILLRLGKLPKKSPYVEESTIEDDASQNRYKTEKGNPVEDPCTLTPDGKDLSLEDLRSMNPEEIISVKFWGRRGGASRQKIKVKNLVLESTIDFPQEDLDPAVWNKKANIYTIKPEIKGLIFNVLDKYEPVNLREIADTIHITGSIGTNQYTEDADVDVHIVTSPMKVKDGGIVQKEVFKFFREEGNVEYVGKHPIEVYIQFNPKQELMSEAVYDLLEDKWVVGPKIVHKSYNPYEDFADVLDDVADAAEDADELLGELKRDVVDYDTIKTALTRMSGLEKQRLFNNLLSKLQEIEDDIGELMRVKGEWIKMRREASLPASEEEALKSVELAKKWKSGNAIFKFLNRYRYMKVIGELEHLMQDEDIGHEEIDVIKRIVGAR